MGFCMADSLMFHDGLFDGSDMRARFHLWWNHGYCNAFRMEKERKRSVGLGGNICLSLDALKYGEHPPPVFEKIGEDAGNGSLMRYSLLSTLYMSIYLIFVSCCSNQFFKIFCSHPIYASLAPIALAFHAQPVEHALAAAAMSSYTTHPGPLAAECCAFVSYLIIRAIHATDPIPEVIPRSDLTMDLPASVEAVLAAVDELPDRTVISVSPDRIIMGHLVTGQHNGKDNIVTTADVGSRCLNEQLVPDMNIDPSQGNLCAMDATATPCTLNPLMDKKKVPSHQRLIDSIVSDYLVILAKKADMLTTPEQASQVLCARFVLPAHHLKLRAVSEVSRLLRSEEHLLSADPGTERCWSWHSSSLEIHATLRNRLKVSSITNKGSPLLNPRTINFVTFNPKATMATRFCLDTLALFAWTA